MNKLYCEFCNLLDLPIGTIIEDNEDQLWIIAGNDKTDKWIEDYNEGNRMPYTKKYQENTYYIIKPHGLSFNEVLTRVAKDPTIKFMIKHEYIDSIIDRTTDKKLKELLTTPHHFKSILNIINDEICIIENIADIYLNAQWFIINENFTLDMYDKIINDWRVN